MTSLSRAARRRCSGIAMTAAILAAGAAPSRAQIAFEDVTQSAGVSHHGVSWGAAWGDFDGDDYPDLWLGNHNQGPPRLYANTGAGSFVDVFLSAATARVPGDRHGAAWADFDNDGDRDLFSVEGNSIGFTGPPNQFLVNDGGTLTDEAADRGLAYPDPNPFDTTGSTMTPLWLDYDGDGRLDVATLSGRLGYAPAGSRLFRQNALGSFDDVTATAGFLVPTRADFAQVTGFGIGRRPMILVHDELSYPGRAYYYDVTPFESVPLPPLQSILVKDVAIADFDGDLEMDLYLARKNSVSDMRQVSASHVRANLLTLDAGSLSKGVVFYASGPVDLRIAPTPFFPRDRIFIGSGGHHPPDVKLGNAWRVILPADAGWTHGWAPHQVGVDSGLFIGRHPTIAGLWAVFVTSPGWLEANIDVFAQQAIALTTLGFTPAEGGVPDRVLAGGGGSFVDASAAMGVAEWYTPAIAVAAGDFDNDADVDVYLVCTRGATNYGNLLLENDGGNGFRFVPGAGGAAGSVEGIGENVAVADYDLDGFLDLVVTNGGGNPHFNVGPVQLFRNLGNGNHWLEIDLIGVASNRDGIGSRVVVTAGGKAQVREQAGGAHRFAQNHSRLHFGLGTAASVESVVVEWPGGTVQTLENIPSDQLIRITEPVP